MNYKLKYKILIQWSDEDNCYLVSLPDLFQDTLWVTHGETYQEALDRGIDVMEDTIETMEKEGKPLPPVSELQSA